MFDVEEPKTKGLGRGLNALFEDADIETPVASAAGAKLEAEVASTPGRKRLTLGVEQLEPSPFQPRRVFEDEPLRELADSIREIGILQPLLVRLKPDAVDEYHIVAGERRWRAAQIAQLHEVPVIILEMSELEAFKAAMIENLQREDLDPMDEAYGYQRLLNEYNQTKENLAKAVGKSRSHVSNTLRLLQLPSEVQRFVSSGALSAGHARALVTAANPLELANEIIDKGLSVRQTEKLAADAQGREQKKQLQSRGSAPGSARDGVTLTPAPVRREKDADTLALENDMTNALGMRVTIDSSDGRSGLLSIEFKSLDQLDEVLHRLAHFPGSRLSN